MNEIGYGTIRISPEMLDDLQEQRRLHFVFSGVEILYSTEFYELNKGEIGDLKYIEYFCKSSHFYRKKHATDKGCPRFAFKMTVCEEGSTGDLFGKRYDIEWNEVEEKEIEGLKCLIRV